jgi:hypothetical protein
MIKVLLKRVLKWTCAIFLFFVVLVGSNLQAQNSGFAVNGTITDDAGSPLPGVNIL